ncbi:hypothetical protein AWB75_04072 [Caballeronia catudaia]|uniref:Uncharacterized protein n=1 Tax=Caballeronia catudaia TaxID=1777136 RepID=A0A158BUR2_9BURK|nr:hypothetical protein AWB75_04072 [Caballeronia catudaia]
MATSTFFVTSACCDWLSGTTSQLIFDTSTPCCDRYFFVTNSAHAPKLLNATVLPSKSFGARMPESLRVKYFICGASGKVSPPADTTLISAPLAMAEMASGTIAERLIILTSASGRSNEGNALS